jgi:ketosteroid isomerase-like protein
MLAMYEAYNRRGTEAILPFVDPAVEWSDPPEWVDGGLERGHDGVRRGLARWTRQWDQYRIDPVEFLDAGLGRMLVCCRQRGRGEGSGVIVESDLFMVWTLHNARAVEMRMFFDRDEALRALRSGKKGGATP